MRIKNTEFRILEKVPATIAGKPAIIGGRMRTNPAENDLRAAYRTMFRKAANQKKPRIYFFAACIREGFPVIGAAKILSQEILRFCRACPGSIKEMVLVIPDKQTRAVFQKEVFGYIRHIQEDLGCGPYCTVDMIIEYRGGIVVIERTNPPFGFALPGGFVDAGESLEQAAVRETREETNLDFVNFRQFHAYSDPDRDPRFQTISTVFAGKGKGRLRSGDDAKGARVVAINEIDRLTFAFDHKTILRDYLSGRFRK